MSGKELSESGNNQPLPTPSIQEGYVLLPISGEQFKEFVTGLLGSPQSIGKSFFGSFEVEPADVRNLYHLLLQRVTQQNDGFLASFVAKLIFSDNSSIEVNSIEQLMTYNEVRPVLSRGLHLTWNFLVRFQDKKTPEKQRIQVSLISGGPWREIIDDDLRPFDEGGIVIRSTGSASNGGVISFRIEHTARTWGADMEALLSSQLESLLIQSNKWTKWISDQSGWIGFFFGALFFLGALAASFVTARRFAAGQIAVISQAINTIPAPSIEAINVRLETLSKLVASGAWEQFMVALIAFLFVSVFLALIFGVWITSTLQRNEPSFVLFTKQTHKAKVEYAAQQRRSLIRAVLAIAVDILVSVASNIVFAKLFT